MSLLAPLYFFGALAIGLPILFHLIRRRPKGEVEFSSLMFLRPTPPRLTRRSRLDNWPLLLLRALALTLLAAAFARPFLRSAAMSDAELPGRRLVLMIDTSASMQRAGLWQQALDKARDVLADLQRGDELAIVTFDGAPKTLLGFEESSRLSTEQIVSTADSLLREITPTWLGTDMGRAISYAADLAATYETQQQGAGGGDAADERTATDSAVVSTAIKPTGPAHLILVSDMQAGSQIESLQVYAWPDQLRLDVRPVVATDRTNAWATILVAGPESTEDKDRVRVRVSNSPDATESRFRIRWERPATPATDVTVTDDTDDDDDASASVELPAQVPPGQSRVMRMPAPAPGVTSLLLRDDAHSFDNTRFVVSPEPQSLSLLHVGTVAKDPRQSLLYYLQRVPLNTERRIVSVESVGADELQQGPEPGKVPLVVVTDPVSESSSALLKEYLSSGGRVLVVLADEQRSAGVIASVNAITGLTLGVEEAEVEDYVMFSKIDFRHPVFESMADPQFNDFTKIRFWSHRSLKNLDESWQVAASFDDGDPALIQRDSGDGQLLVLAAGWQPTASQLALSTKFIPLVFSLFEGSRKDAGADGYILGEPIDFQPSETATIRGPAGTAFKYRNSADLDQIDQPGVYEFRDGDVMRRFAVNLDESESHTEPLGEDALERFDVVLGKNVSTQQAKENQRQLRDRELENRQRLWQWLLVTALGVLGLETFLGARWSRRSGGAEGEQLAGAE